MKKKTLLIILGAVALAAVITLVLCLSFSGADVPEDPNEAVSALQAAEYLDVRLESGTRVSAMIGVGGLNCKVSGFKISDKVEFVEIYYFSSDDYADEAWLTLQKLAHEDPESSREDFVCEKSGSIIWFGTEAAVSATRGEN